MTPRLDLLELLADRLETEKRIPFFYGTFVGSDWEGDPDLRCGTTACAAGLATTMPEFMALGLKLFGAPGMCTVQVPDKDDYVLNGAEAMGEILGLAYGESAFLFYPLTSLGDNISPPESASAAEVAAHIRAFVKRKREEMASADVR
jgi:hypothetical protein